MSDTFAAEFQKDISTACDAPAGVTVADVAAGIATMDTTDFN